MIKHSRIFSIEIKAALACKVSCFFPSQTTGCYHEIPTSIHKGQQGACIDTRLEVYRKKD